MNFFYFFPSYPVWLSLVVWGLAYLADYYLTIYSARRFQSTLREHIRFEGSYELTPTFQKDIDALRPFSLNFLLRWALSFPLMLLVWYLSVYVLGMLQFYDFLVGGLLLREAAVLLRHARNIALVRDIQVPGSIRGQIEYSRWLTYRMSAAEIYAFALFFTLLAGLLQSWFFLGGGLVCALTAFQHSRYARRFPIQEDKTFSADARQ
jgi:hypothetical protein